jgi:addiction module HigA family antidote
VHPGEWLRAEIVEPHGLTVTVAAGKLGVTRQAMSNLLNGQSMLSAEMAIRFEKAFGIRADSLLRMQAFYDLTRARANEGRIKVERIVA